jgi:hypothetical protein
MSERERTPAEWARAYDSVFHDTKKHYMVTYWKRIYDRIHPKFTQPGTDSRKICLDVLKKTLNWHLEITTNGDERTKIKHALTEIEKYAD